MTTSAPSSSSWNLQTPSSLPGRTVNGIPLETSPASLASWTTQVTQAQAMPTNATSLSSVFYPLATGYSIVAGDCTTEANNYSAASLSASPGGTASPTVPLGLLPLEVVNPLNGTPVGGATITLTSTQCSPDSYTMPTTDAQGMSRNSTPVRELLGRGQRHDRGHDLHGIQLRHGDRRRNARRRPISPGPVVVP